ncbi:DUF4232 domain-containing protein [Frankia sp. AgB1.9]|uniref:DUF4232 domain-containing protein n=1 Tax=unclassified Frankia TaxID=2632575 RepID=UPI001933577F|nr:MULTISPECIES: DUF4232 domain-containing protein [unclassified Frankia]MBL7492248.1 DUF4232 domain-containing protein [Frankia sp. AgW1.1]MBL7550076.1 DUF4232 domain-containing protein [Frankia sp. AgB1.9]MBL7621180.1 DUF4232 domain-containing protein [Frankia sp. AgB1.8]
MSPFAAHAGRAAGCGHATAVPPTVSRRVTAAACAAAAIALGGLAGCSQPAQDTGFNIQGSPPAAAASGPATTRPPDRPSASASPTARGSASADLEIMGTRCTGAKVTVELGTPVVMSPADPASLQFGLAVTFTNHFSLTCSIFGFPGVALVTAAGATYDLPRRTDQTADTMYLPPGGTASALLTYLQVPAVATTDPAPLADLADDPAATAIPAATATPAGDTFTPQYVLVTPPDDREAVRLDWPGGPIVDQRADPGSSTSIGPVIR